MIGVLWAEFGILYGAALIGGIAIVPYSMRLVTLASDHASEWRRVGGDH